MKFFHVAALFLCFCILSTNAIELSVKDIVDAGKELTDIGLTCNKYDAYGAGCFHNDWERRDRICGRCMNNRWSYKPWFGGKCYCCKYCH